MFFLANFEKNFNEKIIKKDELPEEPEPFKEKMSRSMRNTYKIKKNKLDKKNLGTKAGQLVVGGFEDVAAPIIRYNLLKNGIGYNKKDAAKISAKEFAKTNTGKAALGSTLLGLGAVGTKKLVNNKDKN